MKTNKRYGRNVLDLTSEAGNVYYIIAMVNDICNQMKLKGGWKVIEEMRSGDYANAIRVAEHYFGDIIKWYSTKEYDDLNKIDWTKITYGGMPYEECLELHSRERLNERYKKLLKINNI